jgi:LuxR family quorum sensing-dependent transcriptional regulator
MFSEHDIYGKRALDFVEDLQRLDDYDAVCRRITEELEWFGYTCVSVWNVPGPAQDLDSAILFNNRPEDYSEHYKRQNLVVRDPVVIALRSNVAPFTWDDVRAQGLSKSARQILDEGRDFDARNGLVVPILTASGALALFSPCGRDPNVSPRARAAVEMIGIYSHQALQRVRAKAQRERPNAVPLTAREREIIRWVAIGKSDDEIATILGIGRQTVLTHLDNAKRKLDATRRTYAVVQALRYGEITI